MIEPCLLGEAIRTYLRQRGWPQSVLASAIGVSTKHLSLVISGKAGISAEFAVQVEEMIGLDAERALALDAARRLEVLRDARVIGHA